MKIRSKNGTLRSRSESVIIVVPHGLINASGLGPMQSLCKLIYHTASEDVSPSFCETTHGDIWLVYASRTQAAVTIREES